MSNEVILLSTRKEEPLKAQKLSMELGSCSSKSDKFVSASKSVKAFQDSLRKYDTVYMKRDEQISPLKKKLSFGKNQCSNTQENQRVYVVDIKKKIKAVQSPFKKVQQSNQSQDKLMLSETNMLVSSFNSIQEKSQEFIQNSAEIQKVKQNYEISPFQGLTLEIQQIIKVFEEQHIIIEYQQENVIKLNENDDVEIEIEIQMDLENHSGFALVQSSKQKEVSSIFLRENSEIFSSKSRSSDELRLRKKNKKRMIKKMKKNIAKSMNIKLENITNFVDSLHVKQPQTDRKTLINELTNHLCEKKFGRLRNELKKLI